MQTVQMVLITNIQRGFSKYLDHAFVFCLQTEEKAKFASYREINWISSPSKYIIKRRFNLFHCMLKSLIHIEWDRGLFLDDILSHVKFRVISRLLDILAWWRQIVLISFLIEKIRFSSFSKIEEVLRWAVFLMVGFLSCISLSIHSHIKL